MDDFTLVQTVLLFGVSLFFTGISLRRDTALAYLITGLMWLATGLINFAYAPTTNVSLALGYFFVVLGCLFMLLSVKTVAEMYMAKKEERWRFGL